MNCILCNRADATIQQYGKNWCCDCTSQLQFEERLARARGMTIQEIRKLPTGDLQLVFDPGCQPLSTADLHAILPTLGQVLEQILAAVISLKERVDLSPFGCRVPASAAAREPATRLVDLLEKYGPLLDADLMRDIGQWRDVALRILRHESISERN
jgi:hypothetical protein